MAKNTIADLDTTAANNTDVLNQNTAGSAAANTLDTIIQNTLGLLARFYADIGALGTVAGTADAITLTTASTYQALENGLLVAFKAGSANTGAATINVDSLGAKAIRRPGDSALSANDIIANGVYLLRYDTAYNSSAGAWVLLNQNYQATTGVNELFIPATAMTPQLTNGAAPGITELSTNLQPLETLDYDTSTQEFAVFPWAPPKRWNLGTITFVAYWTAASGSGGVVWAVQGAAASNDDVLNPSYGTEQTSTDTLIAANDLHISPESSAITIGGTPADADLVWLRIKRVPANASDDLAVDAKLIGVKIFYTVDQGNDA